MTPKEKAEDLVYKMKFPKPFPHNLDWARNCAIVTVNELIKNRTVTGDEQADLKFIEFYETVLLEIPSVE